MIDSMGAVISMVSFTNFVAILPDLLFFILEMLLAIFSGVISLNLNASCNFYNIVFCYGAGREFKQITQAFDLAVIS